MLEGFITYKKLKQIAFRLVFAAALSTFVSMFSVTYFSVRYGARVPLEGVAYQFLFVIITAALIFAAGLFVFEYFFGIAKSKIGTGTKASHAIYAILVTLGIIILVFITRNSNQAVSVYFWESIITWQQFYIAGILCTVATWVPVIFKTAESKIISALSYVLYTVFAASIALSFCVQNYPSFLRTIGYGGGMIVDVELDNGETLIHVGLFVRSKEQITVYDPSLSHFRELKNSSIEEIRYLGNHFTDYILPCEMEIKQYFLEYYGYNSVRPESCINGIPYPGGQAVFELLDDD